MTTNHLAFVPKPAHRQLGAEKFDDQGSIEKSLTAEVVIALCGPLGTPLHEVADTFKTLLTSGDYSYDSVEIIRLSHKIREASNIGATERSIKVLIEAGNRLRRKKGNAVLARMAIQQIALARAALQPKPDNSQAVLFDQTGKDTDVVTPTVSRRVCHIIDSIKHIDELKLLRSVYGDMLHVVSVYTPIEKRIERLERRKAQQDEIHNLIDRDSGEEVEHGQRVEDTFPQADFFLRVDMETDAERKVRVRRFLDLMLGTRIVTPTAHERAMYAAYSAARNSACLSRQVGAAMTSHAGDVISTGWNDVPRAFGGLYETAGQNSSHDKDMRCWNLSNGRCFNDEEKNYLAGTMARRLREVGLVTNENEDKVMRLIRDDSQVKNLIEFSRAVHAEMHALLNAGSSHGGFIRGGSVFVTTYPCHSCARHLVAAGIKDVYFLEPYRKSLATKLHADAITEHEDATDKVRIMPFDGVAPSRFLKFFSAHPGGRKDQRGQMNVRPAHPVTSITLEAIPTLESFAVRALQSPDLPERAPEEDRG